MNDGSLGARFGRRQKGDARNVPNNSSDILFPSPAQDAAPLSAEESMNGKSSGVEAESRKENGAIGAGRKL